MPKNITQGDIDHATRARLDLIVPLLHFLSETVDESDGGFNEDGLSTLRAVRTVAWDGAMYLSEEILAEATGRDDVSLASDVQRFLAVTALATKGMGTDGPAPAIDSPSTVRYLLELAEAFMERAGKAGCREGVHDPVNGAVLSVPLESAVAMIEPAAKELRILCDLLQTVGGPEDDALLHAATLGLRLATQLWAVDNCSPDKHDIHLRHAWSEIEGERHTVPAAAIGLKNAHLDDPGAENELDRLDAIGERWRFCLESLRASAVRVERWCRIGRGVR